MAHVIDSVDGHILWLVATLIRQTEVIDILSNVLQVESLAASSHPKINDNVMLCLRTALDSRVNPLKSLVAVFDRYSDDLCVGKGEPGLTLILGCKKFG